MEGESHLDEPEPTETDLADLRRDALEDRLTEEELATIRERLADPRPNISIEELVSIVWRYPRWLVRVV